MWILDQISVFCIQLYHWHLLKKRTCNISAHDPLDHGSSHVPLSAFCSFPDSTTSGNMTSTFCFRSRKFQDTSYNASSDFQYGYVTFNQVKDASLKRGYLQACPISPTFLRKTLILISALSDS